MRVLVAVGLVIDALSPWPAGPAWQPGLDPLKRARHPHPLPSLLSVRVALLASHAPSPSPLLLLSICQKLRVKARWGENQINL